MPDITLGNRSEATGRYNFVLGADGDVSFDDTEAHAVMTSVIEHKGKYWADASHGSDLYLLKSITSKTPSQAVALTHDGLQPLEDAKMIDAASTTVNAAVVRGAAGRVDIDIGWTTPVGARGREKTRI